MTVATKKLTFEEYLKYDDGTDTRYELVNGALIPMSLGTGEHGKIIDFLYRQIDAAIANLGQDWTVRHSIVGVRSPRAGRWDTSRIPDLTVISTAQWRSLKHREAVIELNEPRPLLVVEVVSESTQTVDYRTKRSEYAVLDIPEYWIVDPLEGRKVVTVCNWVDGFYDAVEYRGINFIESLTFPQLNLTPAALFAAED